MAKKKKKKSQVRYELTMCVSCNGSGIRAIPTGAYAGLPCASCLGTGTLKHKITQNKV